MSLERSLTAAQGYLELGMPAEALRELEQLPLEFSARAEILQLRLVILMRAREWSAALETCEELRIRYPERSVGYIHGAFCLHELRRTDEARAMLLEGPESLRRDPTFHYNMACYEATLGESERAMQYLRVSFSLDPAFVRIARNDPDLASIHDRL